jgi:DNA polymerase-3 subunit beta
MNFTVNKEIITEALQKVQSVVEKKNTLQILSNVLLKVNNNELTIIATDLEVGLKILIPVESNQNGSIAISAKNLFEIIKELPNKPITFTKTENNWIQITCLKKKFNLVGLADEEFPPLPNFENKEYVQAKTLFAKEMIDKTLFSVSTDETRYHLNGAYVETTNNNLIRMVSTDGHRLSFIDRELVLEKPQIFEKGIIIPKKGLTELRKLLDTKQDTFYLTIEKGNLLVKFDKTFLFIRLIEGDYPDYEQVIPKNNNKKIISNKNALLEALKCVITLSNEKSRGVKFSINNNLLNVSANNADLGSASDEIDVEYNGDPIEIGFNARYIIECLQILETEKIEIYLNDKLSPGLIKQFEKDDYTYVVMPMRI